MREISEHFSKAFLARQGTELGALDARLEQVGADFVATLQSIDDAQFYRPVAEGKWSPAQIADHVIRANRLFARSITGVLGGKDILRMPRGRVTDDNRPISPEEEEPLPNRVLTDLVIDFQASLEGLAEAGRAASEQGALDKTCLDQSFFGPMSVLEVLQLGAWHVRHHAKQMSSA